MVDGIGNAIEGMVKLIYLLIPLSILGVWKLIEIIIWAFQNISISIGV